MPERVTERDDDTIGRRAVLLEGEFATVTDDFLGGRSAGVAIGLVVRAEVGSKGTNRGIHGEM